MERALIRKRLKGKTTPWVAALSGRNDGQPEQEDMFHECQEEDPFQECEDVPEGFEEEETDAQERHQRTVITDEQREQIAARKAATMQRKAAREELRKSNQAKAIETKRRRIELNGQERRREFAEYRKLHDPFYSDEEEEPTRARGTAPSHRRHTRARGTTPPPQVMTIRQA